MAAIVKTLTDRYGSKMGLVDGFKAELLSIKQPDESKDAAAADYVTAALSKLQYLLRLAREENLVYELAMLRCEQVVLNVMRSHTALKPFELMFGGMYGDAAEASGFVSARQTRRSSTSGQCKITPPLTTPPAAATTAAAEERGEGAERTTRQTGSRSTRRLAPRNSRATAATTAAATAAAARRRNRGGAVTVPYPSPPTATSSSARRSRMCPQK